VTIEHRAIRGVEIRATDVGGKPGVTLHAIKPGVVDDYGTLWAADAFDESLATRLPTLCWAHDWSEPLGPAVSYRTTDEGPEIDFRFSDFDAVPQARRAHAQVGDGTIQDCSVGFWDAQRRDPTDDEVRQYPGCREVISKAQLDEVSLVLRGAVPGAKVLAVRSPEVAVEAAVVLARRIAEGDITVEEAKAAIGLLAREEVTEGEPPPAPEPVDHDALDAEVDAALAGRSRR
jgi:HK97 family phage prohead protease